MDYQECKKQLRQLNMRLRDLKTELDLLRYERKDLMKQRTEILRLMRREKTP